MLYLYRYIIKSNNRYYVERLLLLGVIFILSFTKHIVKIN